MKSLEEILAYYLGMVKKSGKVCDLIQNRQEISYWIGGWGLLTIGQYLRFRSEYQKIREDSERISIPWHDSDGDEYGRALNYVKEDIWI